MHAQHLCRYGRRGLEWLLPRRVHHRLASPAPGHAISPKPHGFDFASKAELSDASVLMVIPYHNLVRRIPRILPAADKGEDVAAEQHLDDTWVCESGKNNKRGSRDIEQCQHIQAGTKRKKNVVSVCVGRLAGGREAAIGNTETAQ